MPDLSLKIPPPVVTLVFAGAMWLLTLVAPSWSGLVEVRIGAAVLLGLLGAGTMLSGVATFRSIRTTVNPMKPETASNLATTGIYQITRNPMYLGMLLILSGWAMWLANPLSLLGPVLFLFYMNRFQIGPEEAAMHKLFGDSFATYITEVRRWI